MAKVKISNLKKSFGDLEVLKDINLEVEEGEVICIIGPSGSGKSTMLRCINALEEATSGTIVVDGNEITGNHANINLYRRNIGMVFQQFNLFPNMSVLKNITFAPVALKIMDKAKAEEVAQGLLKRVDMVAKADAYPGQLSGGQQQRVAIARALVNEPKVLLLDEPLGALDAKIRKQMQVELKKIQQEVGITFIYVTHDQEEALSMSDTVVVMNNGEIQQIGSPTDIYNEPENRFVAGFIGESNIIEGTMIRDYLVAFDGFEFECVDKGFEDNEEIEVVLRPEDLDIVDPGQAKIRGIVRNITFKGVHYEILIETKLRTYMVHTTDYAEVGREVGLKFGPEDIHVMCKMGSY